MVKYFILHGGLRYSSCLFILLFSWLLSYFCVNGDLSPYNPFTIFSFSYSESELKPFDWRYVRVDLPPWFSSMSIALESDVDFVYESLEKVPKNTVPILCLRDGSPPLPDISYTSLKSLVLYPISNQTFGGIRNLQNLERCYPLQKNITMNLTNEQISPGSWYFGFFNGIGRTRTQSKMINRGSSYSFNSNVSVNGCSTSTMSGQYCNQTISSLLCSQSNYDSIQNISHKSTQNIISCTNYLQDSCQENNKPKIYSLDIYEISEQITIIAENITFQYSPYLNISDISLMVYVRFGAMPLSNLYDYSGDLTKHPLIINLPKIGRWYVTIVPSYYSRKNGENQNVSVSVCYSMEFKILQCPIGKAGLDCTMEKYTLQTFLRRNPKAVFEYYYLPDNGNVSSKSPSFHLEQLLTNSSFGREMDSRWTYFLLHIPYGAAGGNIHVRLSSNLKINYEIYARHGGLPHLENWDYFYANKTHNSDDLTYFKVYDSSEGMVSFYILYAREGTWSFGLRQRLVTVNSSKVGQSTMSISLEQCPNKCSSHGSCKSSLEASGLTLYSYCSCDNTHGGFDCGDEIVTHIGHIWQSIFLIASNAAAVFPSLWALRQKALAEWVLFTCSGVSSGLYHACDVGTWCVLDFKVLQFMDFWLSFMAVVSTFIYLAAIDEGSKRTIHTVVFILTALMAVSGATRSSNIVIVILIGALGLLIGWIIEFYTHYRSFSFSTGFRLNITHRWQTIKGWLRSLVKIVIKRFRWGFVLAGFIALAMAAISWILESSGSYWIWHSAWHVSIYTSSFFFLCSKADTTTTDNQATPNGNYELTRQDSIPRGV